MRKKLMGGGMSNRMMYKEGKDVKGKYPSKGMNTLASKNPDVAEKIMGYKEGGATRKPFKGGGSDRPGLYANIKAKKDRIKAGSGEKMRKVGAKGAPTAQNFKDAAKTAKKV